MSETKKKVEAAEELEKVSGGLPLNKAKGQKSIQTKNQNTSSDKIVETIVQSVPQFVMANNATETTVNNTPTSPIIIDIEESLEEYGAAAQP